MKYARFLRELEDECHLCEFRGSFLNYKLLKKLIRHAAEEGSDARFFAVLEKDLQRVNRVFIDVAERALDAGRMNAGTRLARLVCLGRSSRVALPFAAASPSASSPGSRGGQRSGGGGGGGGKALSRLLSGLAPRRQRLLLLQLVHWCREYAAVNGTALRKICKKHDKVIRTNTGQRFLQTCWQGADGSLGTILHSPLLQELLALETRLAAALGPAAALPPAPAAAAAGADPVAVEPAAAAAAVAAAGGVAGQQQQQQRQPEMVAAPLERSALDDSMDSDTAAAAGTSENGSGMSTSHAAAQQHHHYHLHASPSRAGAHQCSACAGGMAAIGASAACGSGAGRNLGGTASGGGNGSGDAAAPAPVVLPRAEDELDLKCCICLSPLYRPLGLQCGHRFCRPCFLAAAGLANHVGPTRAILAAAPREVVCPQCRQPGATSAIVRLKYLGSLSKERHPDAWLEHRREEAEHRQDLLRSIDRRAIASGADGGGGSIAADVAIYDHVQFSCCVGVGGRAW